MENDGSSRRYRRRANAERNRQAVLRAGIIGAYCLVLLFAGLYLGYKGRATQEPAPGSVPVGSQLGSELGDDAGSMTTAIPTGGSEPQIEPSATAMATDNQDADQISSEAYDAAQAEDEAPAEDPVTAPDIAPAVIEEIPAWPVSGEVVGEPRWVFSEYLDEWRYLPGVEIAVNTGTPVTASMSGRVISVRADPDLGTVVQLEHSGGTTTEYGRLSGCILGVGDIVKQGEEIARAGGPTLYFGTRVNDEAVPVTEHVTPIR
jgi:murein DD-endopeptidase MepM/ murein hydrolase activator NlpD